MRRSVVGTLMVLLSLAASCGGDDVQDDRDALVYAAVIRALVPPPPGAEPSEPVDTDVFVWGGEDRAIPLDVQARVVEELEDYASIRFVDNREEAVITDEPGEPVRNEGVLIVLGSVPAEGNTIAVRASLESDRDREEFRVELERNGGRWTIVEPAELVR